MRRKKRDPLFEWLDEKYGFKKDPIFGVP